MKNLTVKTIIILVVLLIQGGQFVFAGKKI
ncbi:MAG: hypothetical protein ACD_7C00487G0005 [uncultured bacterium]|nr:MAG: hypothetical protein ACD_7C00487G0005 [uncultured bacterium]